MHPALVSAVAAARLHDRITAAEEARQARQARRARRAGPSQPCSPAQAPQARGHRRVAPWAS
jgi:hypothetical protein